MPAPVEINEGWCKGCNICIELCKTDVLELHESKAISVRPDDCTGCMLCEYHCPDFAIKVFKEYVIKKEKKAVPA